MAKRYRKRKSKVSMAYVRSFIGKKKRSGYRRKRHMKKGVRRVV
jgi:hypothetical protein